MLSGSFMHIMCENTALYYLYNMVCSCFITSLLVMETRDKENNISSAAGWELLDSFSSFTKLGNRPASLNCV